MGGRIAVLATITLGVLPRTLGFGFPGEAHDASCRDNALGYLACHRNLAPACIPEVSAAAVEFCSSYLSLTTTTATVGETSTSTTATITIETSTFTSTTTTSTTTTTVTTPSQLPAVTIKRRGLDTCPDL